MTFLPIVRRELRVGARKARSYYTRVFMAATGMVLLGFFLWITRLGWPGTSTQIFQILSWYAFIYCLLAGVLATADSLSSEKRDHTLGLLFLTDLHGYDIILGKLAAQSLGCLMGLLAIFPVLAIPMLMGGVQYFQFCRAAFCLLATLLLSLALGLFVSGLSRNPFRAASAALLLVLLCTFGLPLLSEYFSRYWQWPMVALVTALFSPFYAQTHIFTVPWRGVDWFWISLLAVTLSGAVLLTLTCRTAARAWRDAPDARGHFHWRDWLEAARAWNFGRGKARRALRVRLLERNPFAWLAGRERVSSAGLLFLFTFVVVMSAWLIVVLSSISKTNNMEDDLVVWLLVATGLHLLLLGKVGSAASERLGSDRQSGALELLLCTPLSVGTIVRGQWQALRRQLLGGVVIVWLIHGLVLFQACALFYVYGSQTLRPGEMILLSIRSLWARFPIASWEETFAVLCILGAAVVLAAHWITLGWVGMWLSLKMRQPRFAPWAALGLVLVPPWVLFVFVMIGMIDLDSAWSEERWFLVCFKVIFGLQLLNDLLLSLWAARQLRHRFRTAASEVFEGGRPAMPWPLRLKRGLRWAAPPAVLAVLLALFHLEENWRGERAWAAVEREAAARGDRLEVERPVVSKVPTSQNFAAAPIWGQGWSVSGQGTSPAPLASVSLSLNGRPRGWVSWDQSRSWTRQKKTDLERWEKEYRALKLIPTNAEPVSVSANILQAFSRFDPQIEELREASRRPYCAPRGPGAMDWPDLLVVCNVSEFLRYRASAELAEGRVLEAFEDVRLCLRLADLLEAQPGTQAQLLRRDLLGAALQPVWEGLAQGCWRDEYLCWFQDRLGRIDLLGDCPRVVRATVLQQIDDWRQRRAERARKTGLWRLTRVFSPVGWTYRNQAEIYQLYRGRLADCVEPSEQRVFPAKLNASLFDLQSQAVWWRNAYEFASLPQTFARVQAGLNQAVLACALERYRKDFGTYPETLDPLHPAYLDPVPRDPCSGRPLRYLRRSADEFVLYSVGWNEQDDGGLSQEGADWVWKYPR